MKYNKCLIISVVLLPVVLSCENVFLENSPDNTPVATFEVLWEEMDERYAFFTLKNIDWDSLYNVYRPLIHDAMPANELWNVLRSLLCELQDGHVNLLNGDTWTHWYECPDCPHYAQNFNYNLIISSYFHNDVKLSGPLAYCIIDSVGYIYYQSFEYDITEENIDFLMDLFKDLKGIIFDVRNNGGGDSENIDRIQSRIASERTPVENIYYKTGRGHDDFSAAQEVFVSPEGKFLYTHPVAVLTNRYSFSSANFFASRMSVLPGVAVIGDTSAGGGGKPRFFDLPNGWAVRYSSNFALRPDGLNIEKGVPPDFCVMLKEDDTKKGKDTLIEFAVIWINSQY